MARPSQGGFVIGIRSEFVAARRPSRSLRKVHGARLPACAAPDTSPPMTDDPALGLWATLALAALGVGLGAFAAWRHGLPPRPEKGPRMIPWMWLVLIAATWTLVMLVHAVNLLGFHTGRNF